MISDFFMWFAGSGIFEFEPENAAAAAELLALRHVRFKTVGALSENCKVKVYGKDIKRTKTAFEDAGIEHAARRGKGLPFLLHRLIKRPGLVLGILLFFLIVRSFSHVVWDIKFSGNEKLTDDEITEVLEDSGFSYGTYIPSVDFDSLNSRIMANNPEIAWISVNMDGVTANVQLLETLEGRPKEKVEGVYANLIANEDGRILSINVDGGSPEKSPGDIVKKGDLLISGVIPLRDGGVRFSYPEGVVMAEVERVLSAELSTLTEVKKYTGREISDHSISFFKKSINLFSNGRIEYTNYDKIERKERVTLFGLVPLPLWVTEKRYREYERVTVSRTPEEALSAAKAELNAGTRLVLENCELLRKTVRLVPDDGSLKLEYRYLVLKDISEVKEFELLP